MIMLLTGLGFEAAGAGPRLSVAPEEGPVYAGVAFDVVCTVSWDGDVEEYIVLPAELPAELAAVGWGTVTVASLRVTLEDGRPVVTQTIRIVANSAGTYTVPDIAIPYVVGGSLPTDEETPGKVALVMESFEITVLGVQTGPSRWVGLIVLVVVGGVFFLVFVLQRRDAEDGVEVLSPLERVQRVLHAAKRHRLDGNYYAYYQDLTRVAAQLNDGPTSDPKLLETMQRRTQEVGYQGLRPSDEELEGDQREIERAVARWKEDSRECSRT